MCICLCLLKCVKLDKKNPSDTYCCRPPFLLVIQTLYFSSSIPSSLHSSHHPFHPSLSSFILSSRPIPFHPFFLIIQTCWYFFITPPSLHSSHPYILLKIPFFPLVIQTFYFAHLASTLHFSHPDLELFIHPFLPSIYIFIRNLYFSYTSLPSFL